MNLIEKIWPPILLLILLSVPFLIYQQIQRANQCEMNDGVLVKSASGWACIEVKKIQEK